MVLIILAFLVIGGINFVAIMAATKPTSEQKALDKRITHIKVAPGQVTSDMGGLLLATNDGGVVRLDGRHRRSLPVLRKASDADHSVRH